MHDADFDGIIQAAVVAAAATGPLVVLPVPGADALPMAGIATTMMIAIARQTGHAVDATTGKKVVLAVIAQAGSYWVNVKAFNWLVAKFPGIGWVAGSAANSLLNGAFMVWLGYAFIDLFKRDHVEVIDLASHLEFLQDAMKPNPGLRKLKRIRGFFMRWVRMSPQPELVGDTSVPMENSA